MRPILAGIETEYGLTVEGSGPEDQVGHSQALVESHKGLCFVGWDDSGESPRRDLRGFVLERLAIDAVDALFDRSRAPTPANRLRADRVLANGARFYNDHGHPEYATPECWRLDELVLHDAAGELVVQDAVEAYERQIGRKVRAFKNNSDGFGASYGTHESYLLPRGLGFARTYRALVPILLARTLVCGAGKVGHESGAPCRFQASQRSDFMVEPANAETLSRRPVFNTRDEPHADPRSWMRLHVITGDANMMPASTRRKVGLAKIALALLEADRAPKWEVIDPVSAFIDASRNLEGSARIQLDGNSWTTPVDILRSYADTALATFDRRDPWEAELIDVAEETLTLLDGPESLRAQRIEWAAKLAMLEGFFAQDNTDWNQEMARALELAFHALDPAEGLYPALASQGAVPAQPTAEELRSRTKAIHERTRAYARSIAIHNFQTQIRGMTWGRMTLETEEGDRTVRLDPDRCYPESLAEARSAGELVRLLEDEQ